MSHTLSLSTVSATLMGPATIDSQMAALHGQDEGSDVVSAFPYSHRRSGSTYSLAPTRRPSCRRTNSVVRTGKDIIPLVLKPESAPASRQQTSAADKPAVGHRRGLSINIGNQPRAADTARTLPEQTTRKARPTSMFFDRFFTPKEEDIHASNSSTPTSTSSQTTPRPTGHLASRPQSYHQTLPAPCACKSIYAKTESRLLGKVSDLEAERDTKDLTISILSEQLLDKSQEIELLRMKLAGLERALAGDLDGPLYSPPFDPPFESVLSGGRAGDSAIGSSAGSQGVTSPPRSTTGTTVPTFDGDVSYEELVDENVALRDEVARLSHVLEDGLGALAGLEI